DEQAVDGAGFAVDGLGAGVFQRQAVVFDAAQRGGQVGHHLLRPDDPDRAGGAAGVAGQLAPAGRGDHEGAGFGDRVNAADDDVGGGYHSPDLVEFDDAVHGQRAWLDGVVSPAGVDVIIDARQAERLAGPGEHAGALGYQILDAGPRGGGVVEDLGGEAVRRQRGGRPLQALGGRRV